MLKIRIKNIVTYCAFLILLYPFLHGSIAFLPTNLYSMMPIAATLLICVIYLQKIRFSINELLLWACILFPLIIQNYDISLGNYIDFLNFIAVFLIYVITRREKEWIPIFWNVVKTLCVIQFLLGIFFLINKNLLFSLVIPNINMQDRVYKLLIQAIDNGYMTGICNHYSLMGMYMALGTIAFAYSIYLPKGQNKKISIIIFFAFIIGLAMTGKRGPLIFTIISILIVYVQYSEKKPSKKTAIRGFIGIIAIIALCVIAYYKIPQIQSLVARFFAADTLEEMTSGRLGYFWIQAWEMFKEKPLLGYGWGEFKAYSLNANDAHNIYLQLLAETGIIGFILVSIFFVGSIFAIRKSIQSCEKNNDYKLCAYLKVAYAYQIFFLLYGLTGNPLYDGQCYIPYLLSCAMGWGIYFSNFNSLRR